ncbi:MAG: amidohydrolase family protein, partial [Gemmatimonadota bacterium]|nr:amidohydrolase family protein [Gemmatimonadota bacterium]
MLAMRHSLLRPALALLVAACGSSGDADLVLFNGKVITVDSTDAIAQAVAVKDGRIIAVGTDSAVLLHAGRGTQRVDLKGLTMTPGLLDAHDHFAAAGVDRLFILDLSYPNATSVADVQAKVRERIAAAEPGAWIVGRGWDEGKLAEKRLLAAADLDAIAPHHPVWLTQTMGHYGVANAAALKLAGITKETRDPPGGTIDRNSDGTPTGILKESAQDLVNRLVPVESAQMEREAMASLAAAFNAEGMTGLKDPGINQRTWEDYKAVEADGKLTVRVFALWTGGKTMGEAEKLIAEKAAGTRPYESTGDDHVIS